MGNALPGTFAVRSIGCWLLARHNAALDLHGMLLALVQNTQEDFARSTPPGLWCSNAGLSRALTNTPVRPTMKREVTQHPLPCTWQARALKGLYPAVEAERLMVCTRHILFFLHLGDRELGVWLWHTERIIGNCLRVALEPLRAHPSKRRRPQLTRSHDPMPGM